MFAWLPALCFKKVWKLREVLITTGHRPAQAQVEPAGWMCFSRFCPKSQNFFCKIESKFYNSRVLAGGFVIVWAKRFWFKHI